MPRITKLSSDKNVFLALFQPLPVWPDERISLERLGSSEKCQQRCGLYIRVTD